MESKNRFVSGFVNDSNLDDLIIHQPIKSDGKNEQEAMDFIRKKEKEWLYIFNQLGKQTARYEGETNYVNPPEAELLLRLNNATIVHNHPLDESFSVPDIVAITRYNAKKLVVVSPKYTYIVERNGNYWGFNLENNQEDKALFEECMSQTEQMLHKELVMGYINTSKKNEELNHYSWKSFFEFKNIFYERKDY